MNSLNRYGELVRRILTELANIPYSQCGLQCSTVFDRDRETYMVLSQGWDGLRRAHHVVAHMDIIDGKIWVQRDSTNIGIVRELEEAGVPKQDIVLGFRHPEVRPLTEYAVA